MRKFIFSPFIITIMKQMKHFIFAFTIFMSAGLSFAQQADVNYDESKVPVFTLPDPLTFNNGKKLTTVKQWENQRRPELLEMFASQMYGRTPKDRIRITYEILSENPNFMDEKASCQQVKFIFTNGRKSIGAMLLLILPNGTKDKVPVMVAYNYNGNHTTTSDPSILLPDFYDFPTIPEHLRWSESDRTPGGQSSRWSFDKIIERGYGVATMCYQDIYPDKPGYDDHSIVSLFAGYNSTEQKKPDQWQALGTWAWGMSRIVDYLETQKRVDTKKIIAMGHSRHGKATLWAGVQDRRFAMVISNNSGCGGAALSKRVFGENIARITNAFPHWFCPAFDRYANHEADLPFDQHELVALIAPRLVYICSAEQDTWADPKGEFLAGYFSGPVYQLYGLKGLDTDVHPPLHQPIMNTVGYHIRSGGHDVTEYDWMCWMDFADLHFGKPK